MKTKNNRGFVILFAVTMGAIILSIALGVASISGTEIKFGTSAKDTNDAFAAADTGIECALLYDRSGASANAFIGTANSMSCSGASITPVESPANFWTFAVSGIGSGGRSCARVTVDKTALPVTTIISKGYNVGSGSCEPNNPNRIERELEVSYTSGSGLFNVALSSNGGTATASSTLDSGRQPIAAHNGERAGIHWGSDPATGSGWHDSTLGVFPDWLEISFAGAKNISGVDIFTVQDNFNSPATPTSTMTFTQFGIVDFQIQYWTGSSWQTVPGGSITGNNLIWRQVAFPQVNTDKIRIYVTHALNSYTRITEVEVWGN